MKKLIITSIVALGVAAPALAQSQLELQYGVGLSISELAQVKAYSDDRGGDSRYFLGNGKVRFSAKDRHNDTARAIFAQLAAEAKNGEQ